MGRSFRDALAQDVLVFDGGMGTMLYDKGVFINRCFDELNLLEPALVRSVHSAYVHAGADVLETNTFGANAVKLEAHGCKERLAEIVSAGARLAREVAGERAFVGGSIGPLGIKIEPWGPTSVDEARALFREPAQVLLESGVDLFVLETFADVNEIQQAIRAVRELDPDIPIVAQMTLGEDGSSLYGTAPEVFGRRLEQWGADVVGVNCSVGPAVMLEAVERMARAVHKPLSVQPNAGLPRSVDGRNIYLASPEYMASYARRFVAAGARIVGGCCGTTPEHVRAIRKGMKGAVPGPAGLRPRPRPAAIEATDEQPAAAVPRAQKSALARRLAERAFPIVASLAPRRGLDHAELARLAARLGAAGADLLDVPEGPRAAARMGSEALALLLEREAGVETIVHYRCRDRSLLALQSALLGAYALGLRNVVCETGDHPTIGAEPYGAGAFEVDSIGLANMIHRLNQGLDVGGSPIGQPTAWHLGVVANPTALDLELEVRRFEWKVEAGAEFAVTRPVFDADQVVNFVKRVEHCRIPLLLAVHPLESFEDAEFLSNEVPGCRISDRALERMRAAAGRSPEHARAEGLAIAREVLEATRGLIDGALVAATGAVDPALELVAAAAAARPPASPAAPDAPDAPGARKN